MKISERGLALIKRFEGIRTVAYLDSVGVPTIGYGHTKGVKIGDFCTYEQADKWLLDDVAEAERCVTRSVTAELTQMEYDALVSWTFNLGCAALRNSTLLRKLNDGDYDGASLEILKWDHAGGQKLAGLTRRREAERELFEASA